MMTSPEVIHTLFDRTRSMLDLPDIELHSPLGLICQPKTIPEICYQRASQIVSKARGRVIYVCWSGGIDSTLALSELLKIVPMNQLVVLMDDHSIVEYPDFYEKYIKGKITTKPMSFYDDHCIKECLIDGVIVTGELLDHNFGTGSFTVLPESLLSQGIPAFLSGLNIDTSEMYSRLIAACPREILNVKDFLWWFNYALEYQYTEFKWLMEVDELILEDNIFHFGGGQDWNDFAVSTPIDVRFPGFDPRSYKIQLKQQIFDFTSDINYTKDKIKVSSWRRYRTQLQRMKNKAIFIKTNWERGYQYAK